MDERHFSPPIHTQSDLQSAWRHLMGPWSFGGHSIWVMFIVDDRPVPHLTEITGATDPDRECFQGLAEVLHGLASDVMRDARVAFLRTRPGRDRVSAEDRAWAEGLYSAARTAGVACEVVHLGTRGTIRPLPPDELSSLADPA